MADRDKLYQDALGVLKQLRDLERMAALPAVEVSGPGAMSSNDAMVNLWAGTTRLNRALEATKKHVRENVLTLKSETEYEDWARKLDGYVADKSVGT